LAADALKERKHIKTLVTTAAEHFNKKPQTALDFLQEKGLLPTPLDAKSVARFLRTTTQLSKTMIGEYLAGTKEFTAEVLKEYVLLFDYKNKRFVDVVREFLESFRSALATPFNSRAHFL
jgi:brefeldin A-resistance guanine nucleotide exchange factor 1